MKVTSVKVSRYTYGTAGRIGAVRSPRETRTPYGCIVELSTDEGATGIGIGTARAGAQIEPFAEEMLVGEDPRAAAGLWQRMSDAQSQRRDAGCFAEAIAILDVALWDLKAKANDEPLWKTLGGSRPKANAHASGGDSAFYARMAREHGLRGGKLQMGADEERDLQRLVLMRAALLQATPQPVLSIDADQNWLPKQAISRLRKLETEFDLAWIEGASRSWDFPGLKQISNAVRAAVSVGRGLATCGEFLPHFHWRSADVIEIDIGAVGITGALQLADAAYGFELPVTLSAVPGNIQAHLSGSMPYFMSLEVVDAVPPTPVYSTDVRIEQGWAIAGDAPGNGLRVDRKASA